MPMIPYMPIDENISAFNKAHPHDAGYDMFALNDTVIWPLQTKKISVNIRVCIPPGRCALLTGRSGYNAKGLICHLGTIDAGYTGIINAVITNLNWLPKKIRRGDRVGQLVIIKPHDVDWIRCFRFPETERGENGLGSTGR